MSTPNEPASDASSTAAWISDLADGRLNADQLPACCADWAQDAQHRRNWHTYHLIGDVLRSDDLASSAGHDAAFLGRLRERLAAEPVRLAPPPAPAPRALAQRSNWMWPVAVAAGFVAVAGVLVVLQQAAPDEGAGPRLAVAEPVAPATRVSVPGERAEVIRNARVDEYLRLHRETLAGAPVALPGGAMRSVDLTVPQR